MTRIIDWTTTLVVGVLLLIFINWLYPYDDSDNAEAKQRSGFTVRKDNLTGCEYLSTLFALYPRMDDEGRQICRKENGK